LRYFNVLNGSQESAFLKRAEEEVAEAVEFASHAPPPPVEWAFKDVYGG
jgi:TPP-dependent pyruvate/acetoin dehydrogenase alpha subunit